MKWRAKRKLKMRTPLKRAGLQRYFSALGKHYAYVSSNSSMRESSEDTNRTQPLFPPGDTCVSVRAAKLVVNREVHDRDLPQSIAFGEAMALES